MLWRVLRNRTVLELQAVDLQQKPTKSSEPSLTLRFAFEHSLCPGCVAFTEVEVDGTSSALFVIALSTKGDLYTLKLKQEAFVRTNHLEQGLAANKWFQSTSINALSYKNPHRLLVTNADDLWLSLTDGTLLRLEAEHNNDGTKLVFISLREL